MSSNPSGFVHKVFLTSNRAFAELCASRIRSMHPGLHLEIHCDFEACLSCLFNRIADEDLIRIDYFFIDEMVMALPALDRIPNLYVTFVVSEGIDGVAFELFQYSAGQAPAPSSHSQTCRFISSGLYKGCHIRKSKNRFQRKLISRIETLNIVKSFIPKVHNFFLLGDFLDTCFRKLMGALHATGGVLLLEEKKSGKTIFRRKYGEVPAEEVDETQLRSSQCQSDETKEIRDWNGSKTQIRETGLSTAQICAPVESSHARGYFRIDAERPLPGCGKTLVRVFREQVGLLIDNTAAAREKLKRRNLNPSLIEPEVTIIDKAAGRECRLPAKVPSGWKKDGAPDRESDALRIISDCFAAPVYQRSGCLADSGKHRDRSDYPTEGDDTSRQPRSGKTVTKHTAEGLHLESRFGQIEHLAWLSEFASQFAHEIRNPVTGISSNAQLLYETAEIGKEYKAVIEEILLGSRMLEEVVKKYLNLASPPDPRLEKCCLNLLLEQVYMSMQTKIASQKVTVEFKLREGLPGIYVDPGQVRQVYANLVMNALEAMPEGGKLVIETFLRKDGADSNAPQRRSVVSIISDSGIGIDPQDKERVFDPFYTTKNSGAGLGLYTAFNILRKHDAEIYLLSEAGKGTAVSVGFPVSGYFMTNARLR